MKKIWRGKLCVQKSTKYTQIFATKRCLTLWLHDVGKKTWTILNYYNFSPLSSSPRILFLLKSVCGECSANTWEERVRGKFKNVWQRWLRDEAAAECGTERQSFVEDVAELSRDVAAGDGGALGVAVEMGFGRWQVGTQGWLVVPPPHSSGRYDWERGASRRWPWTRPARRPSPDGSATGFLCYCSAAELLLSWPRGAQSMLQELPPPQLAPKVPPSCSSGRMTERRGVSGGGDAGRSLTHLDFRKPPLLVAEKRWVGPPLASHSELMMEFGRRQTGGHPPAGELPPRLNSS